MKNGSPDAIQILIDFGADKDVRSSLATDYLTPVLLDVVEGQVDCMKKLIENKVDLSLESSKEYPTESEAQDKDDDYGIFALSVYEDQPKCLEYLVSLEEEVWRALESAENERHLGRGTIMSFAADCETSECLKILLEKGTSPGDNAEDTSHAICQAAEGGNLEILDLLLDYNLHLDLVNQDHFTDVEEESMFIAALRGHTRILERLVEVGFRTDFSKHGKMNALHASAVHGHVECLKLCIGICQRDEKHGGRGIKVKDGHGNSALWYAMFGGHSKCVEMLLEARALPKAFEDSYIFARPFKHSHYCVDCQKAELCVCYFTHEICQDEYLSHHIKWEPGGNNNRGFCSTTKFSF